MDITVGTGLVIPAFHPGSVTRLRIVATMKEPSSLNPLKVKNSEALSGCQGGGQQSRQEGAEQGLSSASGVKEGVGQVIEAYLAGRAAVTLALSLPVVVTAPRHPVTPAPRAAYTFGPPQTLGPYQSTWSHRPGTEG
jgi:hypothetical protein